MSDNILAFIFPAFTNDYSDHQGQNMPGFNDRFAQFLHQASVSIGPELARFDFSEKNLPEDELRTQYLTYIYSCTVSSLLRKAGFAPTLNAGYSMGIYASLFDAGSVSFETGLILIRLAYEILRSSIDRFSFGMGTLIGLDRNDIQRLIDIKYLSVEITNQNAPHSFVVSGFYDDIQKLMAMAKQEGALHTRDLAVSVPYHSVILKAGAIEFSHQITSLEIGRPLIPIISLIDQILLTTQKTIQKEIVRNLFHPLNWFRTMNVMLENKINSFIECGPSKSLTKNSKFIDGNYRFYSLNSIPKI